MIAFFIFIFLKNKLDIKGRGGIFGLLFIPTVFYYTHNYKKYNRNYVENYKDDYTLRHFGYGEIKYRPACGYGKSYGYVSHNPAAGCKYFEERK